MVDFARKPKGPLVKILTSPRDLLLNEKIAHDRIGTSVVRYKTARNAQTFAASSGSDAKMPASLLVIASISILVEASEAWYESGHGVPEEAEAGLGMTSVGMLQTLINRS